MNVVDDEFKKEREKRKRQKRSDIAIMFSS